ncbi:ATP-dependent metalloprotease FtsH [Lachnospiraceae bacterium NE2001]|nr:ATP-dependent metalloprotease FtsH [Lachnospiraceae bacterium NE2001]
MNKSATLLYVIERAKAEAKHRGWGDYGMEDAFLGILKLSEIKAEDMMKGPKFFLDIVDIEIKALKIVFSDVYKVDTTELRGLLRREMKQVEKPDADAYIKCMERAEKLAEERKSPQLFPVDLLNAIIEKPSDILKDICDIEKWNKPTDENEVHREKEDDGKAAPYDGSDRESDSEPDGEGESSDKNIDEMSPEFLPELTSRVRRLRTKLLSTVQGQDHVVHSFAEGIFAAEVLAASDENRKRPKAIFAFAGPPGVGKTFLAEQAADQLKLPFMRFDMSTYSDHQSYMGLVGFEKSYSGAKEGLLTGFVRKNPRSILLFDEIEKAHLNTIQLFLQILDAGRLSDRYHGQEVSFRDTIIIFTSNAGKSLYEGDARHNAAGIPRKTILNALETETDPRTGEPFFPAAITSRLATGWPILFNHLAPHDLEKISEREMSRFGELFEKQYGVKSSFDKMLPTALLFREGGAVDARTLRAQTELFFKNEIFKVCRLWSQESFDEAIKSLSSISFKVETDLLTEDVRPLFFGDDKPEILIYGDSVFADKCRSTMTDFVFYDTRDIEEALKLAGEKDIRLVMIDITEKSAVPEDLMATVFEGDVPEDIMMSVGAFDYKPMAAGAFRDGSRLFKMLHERLPDIPVYLLETEGSDTQGFEIDEELTMSFVRAGARGKLTCKYDDFSGFQDEISKICRELYLQNVSAGLAAERKVLYFETAPKLSYDKSEVTIRLRDFSLKRAATAEDAGSVLDEVEKPNVSFRDVIGASDAKEELRFFIDYLKNPKKFTARGLTPPKGVLLYGPPGTGKTMLAKAMAGESNVAFIPAVASSFVTKYQGSGPESVRELFKKARRYAPSIIFIDEIDAVGRKRTAGMNAHGEEMALNALLTEMDGFSVDPKRPVFVLAATNFDVEEGKGGMGVIDPALARRFDRKILVDLPNAAEREELLRLLLGKNQNCTVSDDMLRRTAERAVGMSPANLTSVVELANRMAMKAGKPLDDGILDEAFELTKHGEKKDWGFEYLERVARHESGHAFLCYLGGYTPAYLTIVARGGHGGYMEHSAKEMGPLSTKEELISRIRTSLGGRAAEIVYYGEKDGVSTGASGDLEQATRLAVTMICTYGMDEEFGLAYMDAGDAMKDPSLRKRVNELLSAEMRATIDIISQNKERIDRMVSELLKKNKLTGAEMEELLK